jgi:hypothetical protein
VSEEDYIGNELYNYRTADVFVDGMNTYTVNISGVLSFARLVISPAANVEIFCMCTIGGVT